MSSRFQYLLGSTSMYLMHERTEVYSVSKYEKIDCIVCCAVLSASESHSREDVIYFRVAFTLHCRIMQVSFTTDSEESEGFSNEFSIDLSIIS